MINLSPNKARAELCRRDFFYFIQQFWDIIIPEDPVYNWHIEYLCKELQGASERVFNKEPKLYDIIINISPGSSKSTIATVMLPVWTWIKDPSTRNLTASYSATLSTDHALKSRDIIRSQKFIDLFPEIEIKRDQDNKTHYKNTKGGERLATSVNGTAMGFHAHIIIVDDPLNPKGSASEADRKTANDFMDRTLPTRKVNKSIALTILVMQRLHELDCTGNWLKKKGKKIKHICIPGELSEDVKPIELKKHYVDGLFDAVRLNRNDLDELSVSLGSYGYAGQIMQLPAPTDGGLWKKCIIPIANKDFPTNLESYGSDWDLAYTEKQKNSASAYVSAGLLGKTMYIGDLGFKWLEFPELIKYMKEKDAPHYIEGKASGKSAKQTLTNQGIPAIEVQVDGGDKIARATLATPYAEAEMIYCKQSLLEKLYNDSKQGILKFPNGENDDLQDALVQSINRLLGTPSVFTF